MYYQLLLFKRQMKGVTKVTFFKSNSDEIKHHIREFLKKDGKPHSRKEIIDYFMKSMGGKDVTDGQIAGSFQSIVKEKGFITQDRGVYQYVGGEIEGEIIEKKQDSITDTCKKVIDTAIEDLKHRINMINPLEMNETDFGQLLKAKELLKELETLKNNL